MDRRTYERMMREILVIHHAVTGEEPRVEEAAHAHDEARADAPSEDEIVERFTALASDARSIPSVAFELWAMGLDEEPARGAEAPPRAERPHADAED